jgi:hypothetical protein
VVGRPIRQPLTITCLSANLEATVSLNLPVGKTTTFVGWKPAPFEVGAQRGESRAH